MHKFVGDQKLAQRYEPENTSQSQGDAWKVFTVATFGNQFVLAAFSEAGKLHRSDCFALLYRIEMLSLNTSLADRFLHAALTHSSLWLFSANQNEDGLNRDVNLSVLIEPKC